MARVAVILAIAAIPEGLLIAVTVILVIGMRRILKRQGLVKRLLGCRNVRVGDYHLHRQNRHTDLWRNEGLKGRLCNAREGYRGLVLCNNLEDSLEVALWDFAKANGIEDPEEFAKIQNVLKRSRFQRNTVHAHS